LLFIAIYPKYWKTEDRERKQQMAADTAVAFEGRRWPGARAISTSAFRRLEGLRSQTMFSASGKGQQWSADRPLAFWRNFSALDLSDTVIDTRADARVIKFLSRYGDPTGQLDRWTAAGKAFVGDAVSWKPLIEALGQVAAAWDEPDALGVSSWGGDTLRAEAADKALRKLLPTDPDAGREISEEIKVLYTRQGLTLWPQTLRAFMVISAASARERGIDMRRCSYCEDWFELRRSDAVYCSPSCQATDHKRRSALG
jgi:hypothetical protein